MSTDRVAYAGDYLTANFNARSFGGRVEAGYRVPVAFWGKEIKQVVRDRVAPGRSLGHTDTP